MFVFSLSLSVCLSLLVSCVAVTQPNMYIDSSRATDTYYALLHEEHGGWEKSEDDDAMSSTH